jgi:predicted transcriptional regulator
MSTPERIFTVKYRSRTDIVAMILQAATQGATKTRLMYSAFLSHSQLQEYLQFLLEKGLLAHDPKSGEYKLTERGLRFVQVYEDISKIVSRGGEMVESPSPSGGEEPTGSKDARAVA